MDLEGPGREAIAKDLDVSRTVGWFTSVFPLVLNGGRGTALAEHIKTVKESMRTVPVNGIGYGILRYLTAESSLASSGRSQLFFNYLGQLGNCRLGDFEVSSRFAHLDAGQNTELLYPLELVCAVDNSQLRIKLTFSTLWLVSTQVQELMSAIEYRVNATIDHCCAQHETTFTPSDFSDDEIDMDELDAILEAIE
jgi:non-ribosomal peptide synthase protein (TIGR01720 family)